MSRREQKQCVLQTLAIVLAASTAGRLACTVAITDTLVIAAEQAERARKQAEEAGVVSGHSAHGKPKKVLSSPMVARCVAAIQALMQKPGAELFSTPVDKVTLACNTVCRCRCSCSAPRCKR